MEGIVNEVLGEPELGAALLCESDHHVVAAVGSDVALTRTRTIMQGAAYCDFRYRMKDRAPGVDSSDRRST